MVVGGLEKVREHTASFNSINNLGRNLLVYSLGCIFDSLGGGFARDERGGKGSSSEYRTARSNAESGSGEE